MAAHRTDATLDVDQEVNFDGVGEVATPNTVRSSIALVAWRRWLPLHNGGARVIGYSTRLIGTLMTVPKPCPGGGQPLPTIDCSAGRNPSIAQWTAANQGGGGTQASDGAQFGEWS